MKRRNTLAIFANLKLLLEVDYGHMLRQFMKKSSTPVSNVNMKLQHRVA